MQHAHVGNDMRMLHVATEMCASTCRCTHLSSVTHVVRDGYNNTVCDGVPVALRASSMAIPLRGTAMPAVLQYYHTVPTGTVWQYCSAAVQVQLHSWHASCVALPVATRGSAGCGGATGVRYPPVVAVDPRHTA